MAELIINIRNVMLWEFKPNKNAKTISFVYGQDFITDF